MAADPFRVFREGSSQRQETIKMLWPELYEALALPAGGNATRQIACVVHSARFPGEREVPPVVGRLTRNGHPACRLCIDAASDRPGGWPLKLLAPGEKP